MKHYNLILLSWTIKPDQWITVSWYNKSLDPEERLRWYVDNINLYLNVKNIDWVVFTDNSGFEIPSTVLNSIKDLANQLWKDIELLSFKWDSGLQKKYTYWYWEFEILEYFSKNSKLLKKTDSFYKVAWRYKIDNIEQIISKTQDYGNLFYKFGILDFDTLATSFFKLDTETLAYVVDNYKKHFYSIDEKYYRYIWAENIFFSILYWRRKFKTLKIYPKFHYLSKNKYLIYDYLLKIWVFDLNSILVKSLIKLYSMLSLDYKVKYLIFIKYISRIAFNVSTK